MTEALKPHRGSMVLVLGILSIVVCQPLGFFAWSMGKNDLRKMDKGIMDPEGRGITDAGKICGIIGVAIMFLGLGIWFLMFVLAVGAAVAGA